MFKKALSIFIFIVHMPNAAFSVESNPYAAYGNQYSVSQDYQVVSNQDCGSKDKNQQNIMDMATALNKAFEVQGSICSLKPGQFDEIIKNNAQSFDNSLALSDSIKRSQVLIAGETHLFTDLKARKDIINKFADLKRANSCVVFELPQSKNGLDNFMKALKETAKKTRENGPEWQANDRDDLITYFDSMITHAKSKGLKVFGVDHPENFQKDLSNPVRNTAMTNNIGKLIDEKSCDAVLLFVGKAHETRGSESDPAISTLLKKRSFQVSTINVQMTYENSMPGQIRTWDTCPEPKSIANMVVIKGADMPEGIKISPKSGEAMTFKDFDFTILVPSFQKDYPCSSCVK